MCCHSKNVQLWPFFLGLVSSFLNHPRTQVIFFFFFPEFHSQKLGVHIIDKCFLYTINYGCWFLSRWSLNESLCQTSPLQISNNDDFMKDKTIIILAIGQRFFSFYWQIGEGALPKTQQAVFSIGTQSWAFICFDGRFLLTRPPWSTVVVICLDVRKGDQSTKNLNRQEDVSPKENQEGNTGIGAKAKDSQNLWHNLGSLIYELNNLLICKTWRDFYIYLYINLYLLVMETRSASRVMWNPIVMITWGIIRPTMYISFSKKKHSLN